MSTGSPEPPGFTPCVYACRARCPLGVAAQHARQHTADARRHTAAFAYPCPALSGGAAWSHSCHQCCRFCTRHG
eukprot:8433007-Alexandrium_andersonii.AAC.1